MTDAKLLLQVIDHRDELVEMLDRLKGHIYHTHRYGEPPSFDCLTQEDWDEITVWGEMNDPQARPDPGPEDYIHREIPYR